MRFLLLAFLLGLTVLVVLAKVGDNAGYFVGRAIGQRHPFPTISPGKTVAGCVASLLAGVATGSILLPLTLGERTWGHAALGALAILQKRKRFAIPLIALAAIDLWPAPRWEHALPDVAPVGAKDLFSGSRPDGDAQFLAAVQSPEVPKLIAYLAGLGA